MAKIPARSVKMRDCIIWPFRASRASGIAHAPIGLTRIAEVLDRRLGSPLDTVIDILDSAGKPVPRYTLRAVAETTLRAWPE